MGFNLLLLVILFLRVYLFNLQSFHIDMGTWEAWSYRLVSGGIPNFYAPNYFSDYFPGYLYILWIFGNLYHFFLPNVSFANFNFEILLKLITTAFDFGTSYFIYKIVNKHFSKLSKFAALLYLVNPAVIFNSSIWGQIDGIPTFFLVCSTYLLIELKKPFKSSFLSSISVLIKPQSLAIFPIILIYEIKLYKKKLGTIFLIVLLTFILLSMPFLINDPINGFINLVNKSFNVYPYNSLFAFNFWGILGWWKLDKNIFFMLSYQTWGVILYSVFMLINIYPLLKNKIKPLDFYLASSLSFMIFYLFFTRIHERYLFPFLAFILISAFISKSKILGIVYFIISIVHFINLWYVYYFYNFVYNNIKANQNLLFKFITDNHGIFSLILIISFFYILFFYYRLFYEKISK